MILTFEGSRPSETDLSKLLCPARTQRAQSSRGLVLQPVFELARGKEKKDFLYRDTQLIIQNDYLY